ncbi:hypothetical protein [Cyanobium sp. FACHB-13342]|uniref:hypothetical protein n=1 Tax=Cyanobium sp. FACHB-13342 TaxID=2692793 RepID=UPI0016812F1A|nr:hypothetical protein [Cyanobium sp. FACHB-13342]MBD2422766.1 hypothetical protein [Cyanobium sp. FACHB-13342]
MSPKKPNPIIFAYALRALKYKRHEAGSIILAILAFLVVIIGAVALASRVSSGYFGAVSQARNREARDAAESGVIQIIEELNRETNRKALVAGNSVAWLKSNPNLINACTKLNSSGVVSGAGTQISDKLINYKNPSIWHNVVSGNTARQFQLDFAGTAVEYRNTDRSLLASITPGLEAGSQKSLIRISVIGRVMRNGQEVSRARITREFEVVPKCCRRSFGQNLIGATNYGNDSLKCFSDESAGNGLIVGMSNGIVDSSKNTLTILNDSVPPKQVSQAICWDGGTLNLGGEVTNPTPNPTCGDGMRIGGVAGNPNNTGTSLVPVEFPLTIPPFPVGGAESWPVVDASTRNRITIVDGKPVQCKSDGTDCVELTNCLPSSPGVYACRLSQISKIGNNGLLIDSSNGQFEFYFDDNAAKAASKLPKTEATKYIDLTTGTAFLRHVKCAPGVSPCNTSATIFDSQRVTAFAFSSGLGTFELQGNNGLAMDIIAPYGSVDFIGNSSFTGRIWVSSLYMNGSVTLQVPKTNPGFCEASPDGCPPKVGALIDYVARSYAQASGF